MAGRDKNKGLVPSCVPFNLIFRTPTQDYRTNHYGVLQQDPCTGVRRVMGCIDPSVYEKLGGLGRNEQQLLVNMEPRLREKTYLVVQTCNSPSREPHPSYAVIKEMVDRIIYEYVDK